MIITTTNAIESRTISQYHGVIAGEAILGVNIVKDLFAGISDIVGGRSGTYERELERARQIALDEIAAKARNLGADAVVGVDIDYEVVGTGKMLMVSVSGTAVSLK